MHPRSQMKPLSPGTAISVLVSHGECISKASPPCLAVRPQAAGIQQRLLGLLGLCSGLETAGGMEAIMGETETRSLLKQPARAPPPPQDHPHPHPFPCRLSPASPQVAPLVPSYLPSLAIFHLQHLSLWLPACCGGTSVEAFSISFTVASEPKLEDRCITAQDIFSSPAQQT